MKSVLITGARGFLGRNLAAHLLARGDCKLLLCDLETSAAELNGWLLEAEVIFHLAGVNRPLDPGEFESGNAGFTERICELLREAGRTPRIVFASSIQAELDNAYGISKRRAEEALREFAAHSGAQVRIFRLKNLFGKWCRPNYNSVVATFCHNIANNLPIAISDPANEVELSYVDDVVAAFLADGTIPSYRIGLGDLAGRIEGFKSLYTPDFAEWFNRALYATYISYLPAEARRYNLEMRADARGSRGGPDSDAADGGRRGHGVPGAGRGLQCCGHTAGVYAFH